MAGDQVSCGQGSCGHEELSVFEAGIEEVVVSVVGGDGNHKDGDR